MNRLGYAFFTTNFTPSKLKYNREQYFVHVFDKL